jgi:small subunit ribosomal protein S5
MSDPIEPQNTAPETPATDAPVPASDQAAGEAAQPPVTSQQPQQQGRDQRGGGGNRGGGGGRGGPQRGRSGPRRGGGRDNQEEGGIESSLIRIYRCAKVVKGGRTFSFGALVVAGDRAGNVGLGYGKANEVPMAVEKATKDARRSMIKVPLKGNTIPHTVKGKHGASSVVLVPAMPGSGVTAGKSVRPCLELAGITDILTKAYGSTSPKNLVKATLDALRRLQSREEVERDRGVKVESAGGKELAAV